MVRKSVLLMLAFLVVGTADASATFRIENHLNPAGDPTKIKYSVQGPGYNDGLPYEFELVDGDYLSTGPPPGVYTATALLPPGWVVQDIQCVGPGPAGRNDFVIDVPNGRVTVTHGANEEHICAFTNRKVSAGGSSPSPGVSPTPLPGEVDKVVLPRHPALLGVTAGRGFAKATIRIMRKSVIKARLLRHGRVVGSRRLVLKPGTYDFKVPLDRKRMRRMQRRGLDQVAVRLRIAVTARRTGATHVFKHRVLVNL